MAQTAKQLILLDMLTIGSTKENEDDNDSMAAACSYDNDDESILQLESDNEEEDLDSNSYQCQLCKNYTLVSSKEMLEHIQDGDDVPCLHESCIKGRLIEYVVKLCDNGS